MSTARLQCLWLGLSKGYQCASESVAKVLASKAYARAKTFANIALCSSMAVGYFANFGDASATETIESPTPMQYVLASIMFTCWSTWEYKKGASAQTEEEMLADSQKVITDVNRLYSITTNYLHEDNLELQRKYKIESKAVPHISDEVFLVPPSTWQQLFDSRPLVYMRSIINGGVFATTIYQYMEPGWSRNFSLGGSMLLASLWFRDSIRSSIKKRAQFAMIKACFPIASRKLKFIDAYVRKCNLESTVHEINVATEGRINISRTPSLIHIVPETPSPCVEGGKTKLARVGRAFLRAAAQAESVRILSHVLLPPLAPLGEHILGSIVFLAGAPRAYFKENNAMAWSRELGEFRENMQGIVENIRYVDNVLSVGRLVLKSEDISMSVSSAPNESASDEEGDKFLMKGINDLIEEDEEDLQRGLLRATELRP